MLNITMNQKIISLLLCLSPLSGCMTTTALPEQQRPNTWATALSTPYNFYQVDAGLFRSEQPQAALLPLLQQQQINLVINLRSSNLDQKLLPQHGIEVVHVPIHTWAIDREDLLQVMQQIQRAQQQNKKVLIHCYHGSDRTGASVAMYRIIFQQWPIAEAVREMRQGNYGFHPIWFNIEALFQPENVKWIQQQLSNPS